MFKITVFRNTERQRFVLKRNIRLDREGPLVLRDKLINMHAKIGVFLITIAPTSVDTILNPLIYEWFTNVCQFTFMWYFKIFSQLSITSVLIILYITCFSWVNAQSILIVKSSRTEIISLLYFFLNSRIQGNLSRSFEVLSLGLTYFHIST